MDDGFGDWRIHSALEVGENNFSPLTGKPIKAGSPAYLFTSTTNNKNKPVGFITPSSTAMALNIAMNASEKARELKNDIKYTETRSQLGPALSVPVENLEVLYDYFEQCMISITFSYQALETNCNWEISVSEKLTFPLSLKRYKGEEIFNTAEELERRLSTEEKLHLILPKIRDIDSPKGKGVWANYKKLKRARDSIVHIKSKDQYPNSGIDKDVDNESLYFMLLNQDTRFFPKTAIELLLYFYSKDEALLRWMKVPEEFTKQKR